MHSNRSYCVGLRSLPLWQLGIARHQYIRNIDDGEMTIADRGYADSDYFVAPRCYPGSGYKQKQIMARHETNARLKILVSYAIPSATIFIYTRVVFMPWSISCRWESKTGHPFSQFQFKYFYSSLFNKVLKPPIVFPFPGRFFVTTCSAVAFYCLIHLTYSPGIIDIRNSYPFSVFEELKIKSQMSQILLSTGCMS